MDASVSSLVVFLLNLSSSSSSFLLLLTLTLALTFNLYTPSLLLWSLPPGGV